MKKFIIAIAGLMLLLGLGYLGIRLSDFWTDWTTIIFNGINVIVLGILAYFYKTFEPIIQMWLKRPKVEEVSFEELFGNKIGNSYKESFPVIRNLKFAKKLKMPKKVFYRWQIIISKVENDEAFNKDNGPFYKTKEFENLCKDTYNALTDKDKIYISKKLKKHREELEGFPNLYSRYNDCKTIKEQIDVDEIKKSQHLSKKNKDNLIKLRKKADKDFDKIDSKVKELEGEWCCQNLLQQIRNLFS